MHGRLNSSLLNKYRIGCEFVKSRQFGTRMCLPASVSGRNNQQQKQRNLYLQSFPNHYLLHTTSQHLRAKMSTDANAKFKLTEIEGDLFTAPQTHSLAHCVGADFAMGAGIAVKFKQIYGQVDELLAQGVQSGGVAVLQDKDRYIYYLVTKPQSWDSPTYDSLRSSLTAMREHMRKHKVQKLAIPRIGCGIDGLEWDKVSNELCTVFGGEELEIVVYNFVPK
ncbi:ADP-ribose glycohydrolase OARD1-like [Eurosta solidaginis]|uniref:ADP-ribose glycohydrolase OARD1-like n=1 Tax=Eurosta solidaginis TaxID=178769 RepID=UPI0035307ED3